MHFYFMDQNRNYFNFFDYFVDSIHDNLNFITIPNKNNNNHSATGDGGKPINCGCIIDTSTPETTAQGFNAWLKVNSFELCNFLTLSQFNEFGSNEEESKN